MTPQKILHKDNRPHTISIAQGTEENVDFFFSRLPLVSGPQEGGLRDLTSRVCSGSELGSLLHSPDCNEFNVHQGMNERGTDGPDCGRGVREQRQGSEQLCAGEAPAQQETFIMQISLQPAESRQGVGEGARLI